MESTVKTFNPGGRLGVMPVEAVAKVPGICGTGCIPVVLHR
jgi:hypothetical protein